MAQQIPAPVPEPTPIQVPPLPGGPLPGAPQQVAPLPSALQPLGFKEPAQAPTPPPTTGTAPPPPAPGPSVPPLSLPQAPTTPTPAPQPTQPTIQQTPFVDPRPTQPVNPTPTIQQPSDPGEPPLVSSHGGPAQLYRVRHAGETLRDIARKTLGTQERASEILRLNPDIRSDKVFQVGDGVYLPADACIPVEDLEVVRPLPSVRKEAPAVRSRVVLPLTGTFPANLDDKRGITLPRSIREQLGNTQTILVSPGPDQCLWLTNQAHLDRLADRLEKSPAREADVRVFKRLYFAQTEKIPVSPEGRLTISERLSQFAGLHQEVVLVGIDDHFELWDVARWRQYTQDKSAASRGAADSE
jgi:MraZ protein